MMSSSLLPHPLTEGCNSVRCVCGGKAVMHFGRRLTYDDFFVVKMWNETIQ